MEDQRSEEGIEKRMKRMNDTRRARTDRGNCFKKKRDDDDVSVQDTTLKK